MNYNEDEQTGPAVWADAPGPVVPAMRTFRVIVEYHTPDYRANKENRVVYIDAHSVSCEGESAHFYVYRITQTAEGPALAAYALRMLRPYLDVEDITQQIATGSKTMN